jgi:hypothetical protein
MRWFLAAIGLALAGTAAYFLLSAGGAGPGSDSGDDAGTDLSPLQPFVAGVVKSGRFTVFEGLPHQGYERAALERELATKATVALHGWNFYRDPLPVPAADGATLKELVRAENAFLAYRGPKKCGGYHPDYCLEWRDAAEVYRVLVCLGCSEVKCYGPAGGVHCDMNADVREEFKRLLKAHRKNRPEPKVP